MGLADKLNTPAIKNKPCALRRIFDSLSPEDREVAEAALIRIDAKEQGYTVSWLIRILMSEGITVSDMSIYRHMKGTCSCGTK